MIRIPTLQKICLVLLLPSTGFAVDVTLDWNSNPEPDVRGYRIYHGRIPGKSPKQVEVGSGTQFVLPDLPAGEVCYAWATALNASGLESDPSDALLFIPDPVKGGQATLIPWSLLRSFVGTEAISTTARSASTASSSPEQGTAVGPWSNGASAGAAMAFHPAEDLQTLVREYVGSGYSPDRILITSVPAFLPPQEVPIESNLLSESSPPQWHSLFAGDTIDLRVIPPANGPVSLQWLQNGTPIPGAVSPMLIIGAASSAENGNYQVRILTGEKEIITEPAFISVWPRPNLTFSSGPDPLDAAEKPKEILIAGGSGQPLSLEVSENLTDWALLGTFQLNEAGTRTILDLTRTNRQRFYRLRAGN